MAHSPHGRHGPDLPRAPVTGESLRDAARLLHYVGRHRARFYLALVSLLCSSVLGLAFPYLTGSLVDSALAGRARADVLTGDVNQVAVVLLGLLFLQGAFAFLQSYNFSSVGERSLADLRRDTYARLIALPMAFFAQRRVGELSSRISADLSQIQDTLVLTTPQFLRQSTLLVGGAALITLTSPRLTLLMVATVPPLTLCAVFFGRRIRARSREAQDRLAESNIVVEETLQGIASVKAFANERFEMGRYGTALDAFITAALQGARYRAAFVSFIFSALLASVVLVMWYGSRLVQSGELTVGELTRFILYTTFVSGALATLSELYTQLQRTLGATQRVRELLRETPEDVLAPMSARPERLRGEVEFRNVSFTYPSRREVTVLHDLSLTALPGQRIALVGPSGAGKSTVAALLLRLYDPDSGSILFDGKDARGFALAELRTQMALVPQDVLLFGGTIAENISYGRPGADPAEIEEAARQANAHEFIARFPEGYRTVVGERGVKLSGGQRQRVAIARAILRNPAILILDEATSSLDSASERLVQEALEVLMRGRTSFIIAHRLSTIRDAERIIVVKDGRAVEAGTHDELMRLEHGIYRGLTELQAAQPPDERPVALAQ